MEEGLKEILMKGCPEKNNTMKTMQEYEEMHVRTSTKNTKMEKKACERKTDQAKIRRGEKGSKENEE